MSTCEATVPGDPDENDGLEAETTPPDAVSSKAANGPLVSPARARARDALMSRRARALSARVACVPSCAGNACGADGCGGTCGPCANGAEQCVPPWDPAWQQGGYSNEWWIQFTITGGGVASAYLEVVGAGQVPLSLNWGSWTGSAGFRVSSGSQVILHATDSMGRTAQTLPFTYLTDTNPATDPCKGTGSPTGCEPLAKGMVTITFDDSLESQYTLARPILLAHDMKATIYLVTAPITDNWAGYMTLPEAQALAADGHEIGGHTLTHPDLTQLTGPQIDAELRLSQQWLETNLGVPVRQFATPYGAGNATVTEITRLYYDSLRTVDAGLSYRGEDPYALKAETVLSMTPPSRLALTMEEARTSHGWYILLFHNFTSGTPGDVYTYTSADFDAALDLVAASGLDVVTIGEGIERLRCPPAVPANDTCPGEAVAPALGGSATVKGTIRNATDDYTTFCADTSSLATAPEVVYELDVPARATVALDVQASGFNPALSLRRAECTAEMAGDLCLNLAARDVAARVALEAGTYWVVIDSADGHTGDFTFTVTFATPTCGDGVLNPGEECDPLSPRSDDGCIDPGLPNACHFGEPPPDPALVACPGSAFAIAKGQSLRLGPYNNGSGKHEETNVALYGSPCEAPAVGPENVFQISPAADGTLTARIGYDQDGVTLYCDAHVRDCGDFILYLRKGSCISESAEQVACSDFLLNPASPFGFDEVLTVTAPVTGGTEYWLVVDGLDDVYGIGTYYLELSLQ